MSTTQYEMTTEFHKAFNITAPDKPTILSDRQVINRSSWVCEEVIELLHATAGNDIKFSEMYDELIYKMYETYQRQLKKEYPKDVLTAQVDANVDQLYFVNGNFTEMGIDPKELFKIVHKANMDKIFPDGLPHYSEVGKVIKPDGWVAPEKMLEEEIQRQIQSAQ
jgi:predicted HAD superfamily Cof-like phosphohydrolase